MNLGSNQITGAIQKVRRRRTEVVAARGAVLVLAAIALLLILGGFGAYRFRYHTTVLVALRLGAIAGFIVAAYYALLRPLRHRASDGQVARLIEERQSGLENRLVSAVEFGSGSADERSSAPIIERLVADADSHAAGVDLDRVVPRKRLWSYSAAAAALIALIVGVFLFGPKPLSQGLAQLVSPASAEAAANALRISVVPGSTRVPRGSDQRISATTLNFESDSVTLFTRQAGKEHSNDQWIGQVMEPARAKDEFQFFIFNIQNPTDYFVEAKGMKSETYKLDVADLPFVKKINQTLTFPAYTHLPVKIVEDAPDVAALPGTVVKLSAEITGKARSARIVLREGTKIEMTLEADGKFAASLTVTKETTYHIELTSLDNEVYKGSNEHDISVLDDEPPTVKFEKPGRDTKASSVEEIFTQAKAEDDYGVLSLDLYYSVNGSPDKKIDLEKMRAEASRQLSGTHTFYLEELGLKPGDFISYYAKARDARHEATSDIYFIEVKPFEREFKQAQQNGQQGGSGQQEEPLSRRQKDIVAATFRISREESGYSQQQKQENYNTVALGQERLRDDTNALIERIKRRVGQSLEQQPEFAKLLDNLAQATKEMEGAITEIKKQNAAGALASEQKALQQLLRAESIFREMQVAFGQNSQGNGNPSASAQELADLFELELDKMKNQYETLQREQRQEGQQQDDEAKRKLEELARRQQQQLEQQQRKTAQQPRNGGGGGGGRQQQELIDETRKAARELERLSRERRDPQLQDLSRQLDQAANDMQRAQASSQNGDQTESIAQSLRALQKLDEARKRLDQGQQSRNGQSVEQLRQRAANAASKQQEISKDVEDLAQSSKSGNPRASETKQRLSERKENLANEIGNLEKDIDQTARGMGQQQRQVGEQLQGAASSLRRNRVADRIRATKQMVESGTYDSAKAGDRVIQESLNDVAQQLKEAEKVAGNKGPADSAEQALDRTRQLADNLESLKQKLNDRSSRQGQQSDRQQQGGEQQGGQQQSGQQQNGQQQGGQQQGGQQQGGRQQANRQGGRQQGGQQQGGQQQGGQQQGGQQQGGQQQGGQQQGGQQQGGQQQGGQQQGSRAAELKSWSAESKDGCRRWASGWWATDGRRPRPQS